MEDILFNPILWTVIAVILGGVIVTSIIIGGKRAREVKELDKMFPEGKLASQNLEKIPVEKVRRSTMERERKKKEREKELPKRIRPKKGEKVFAEEDQEFILHPLHRQRSISEEEVKQKKLNLRSDVSNRSNQNTNPSINPSQEGESQTFSSNNDKTNVHTTSNSQRLRTRLKPSGQFDETEANEEKVIQSKLKPFAKTNRNHQSKTSQPTSSEKTFPPRSKQNQQNPVDGQEDFDKPKQQSFQSRSSKYSVKKRFFRK